MTGGTVDVVVVGAGLTGLTCAVDLVARGLDVRVLEAGDAVGGRVRTDHVDGFTLDRGFQVLNTAYPALRGFVDLAALDLRAFDPVVTVLLGEDRVPVANPLQAPTRALSTLRLPLGGVAGKAALGAYAALCLALSADRVRARDDVSAAEAWRRAHVPPDLVDDLLRPFLAGVLLEQDLASSRRFTDLMFKMFARGASTVPAGGMQRLPEQLAARLPEGVVRLGTPVRTVGARRVGTGDGGLDARAVVVATDAWTAEGLLPPVRAPRPNGVTTVYHVAEPFPEASAQLRLAGGGSPVANSIAISVAAPEYAPAGRVLVSSSLVHGPGGGTADPDGRETRTALGHMHGTDASGWQHLATYDLPHALPAMLPPHPMRRPVRASSAEGTVYVAGDHRDTSSIQGALVSGHRVARAVLADLGVTA